jgi:2-hydroxychromene-2-carboxylate isomerase
MTEARAETDSIRFYFSFRSPYAWMAGERLEAELGDLGVAIERIPIYPSDDVFPNDPVAMPAKVAYLQQDVARLTRSLGLTLRFPPAEDPDWSLSHAAFLGAQQLGAGHAFMLELFRKRFSEGCFLGDDAVIGDAAEGAGLDRDAVLASAHSEALRAEVSGGWRRAMERDQLFGVPTFVYRDKMYWGQDRMHFVRAAVVRKAELAS